MSVEQPGKTEAGKRTWILMAIALILTVRIIVQVVLYRSGFLSLTADEFGRVIMAANWSQKPEVFSSGVWLPVYSYLLGTLLRVHWDLTYMPRLLVILAGAASIVLMYLLASELFNSWKVGLISCILLAMNPVSIWLSSTPLTENLQALLVIAALWALIRYVKMGRRAYLFTSACLIMLANGVRFEAWLISGVFSIALASLAILALARKQDKYPVVVRDVVIALILIWVFPLIWAGGSLAKTGNPIDFLEIIQSYKLQTYGDEVSYLKYVETWISSDPFLTALAIPILVLILLRSRKRPEILVYLAIITIPLAIYLCLQRGQIEPPGNYLRYHALFIFLLYPGMGYLLDGLASQFKSRIGYASVLCILIGGMMVYQIRSTFHFTNDSAADGLAVGKELRVLRRQNPEIAGRPAIVELAYWQFSAIHVGANDLDQIIYDRKLDYSRSTPSLLQSDLDQFVSCLEFYRPSYLVLISPETRQIAEEQLKLRYVKEVNGYAFYPVGDAVISEMALKNTPCTLIIGKGK